MRPSDPANSISRSNWAVTTIRSASNWAAIVVPAYQKTQPMKPKPISNASVSRKPAADRQEAADEARTAVEEDREDDPADDEQQRLREDDDAGDEEREPEPDGCALQLADHHRVAEFGGAGALDVHFGGRRP